MVQNKKASLSYVFARKGLSPKSGRGLLQIRIYIDPKRQKYVSTGEKFHEGDWELVQGALIDPKLEKRLPDVLMKSLAKIKEFRQSIEVFELGLIHQGRQMTFEDLDRFLQKRLPLSFNEFMEQQIEADRRLQAGTKRTHTNTLNKLNEFKKRIEFDRIDYELITDFNNWLIDQGLNLNSIQGHHKRFKKYINIAIIKNLIEKNPYAGFKAKGQEVDRTFLLPEEIEKIEALDYFQNMKLDRIKDLFLFACFSGLRFGDLMALAPDHLEHTSKGIAIRIKMEKVNKTVYLPLYALFGGKGELIVIKYLAPGQQSIFASISNQKVNEYLKIIQHEAEIRKTLFMHLARHTFGTNIAARTDDPFLIMRLMGHRDIRTSMRYIHDAKSITDRKLEKIEW